MQLTNHMWGATRQLQRSMYLYSLSSSGVKIYATVTMKNVSNLFLLISPDVGQNEILKQFQIDPLQNQYIMAKNTYQSPLNCSKTMAQIHQLCDQEILLHHFGTS